MCRLFAIIYCARAIPKNSHNRQKKKREIIIPCEDNGIVFSFLFLYSSVVRFIVG